EVLEAAQRAVSQLIKISSRQYVTAYNEFKRWWSSKKIQKESEEVISMVGVFGALRKDELLKMTTDDIEDKDSIIIIRIPDSNHTPRYFVQQSLQVDFWKNVLIKWLASTK
ncbi:hypothetical protein NQ317_014868, partial [Molorchus minor]